MTYMTEITNFMILILKVVGTLLIGIEHFLRQHDIKKYSKIVKLLLTDIETDYIKYLQINSINKKINNFKLIKFRLLIYCILGVSFILFILPIIQYNVNINAVAFIIYLSHMILH